MPARLKTPCRAPGCSRAAVGGYCDEHRREYLQRREASRPTSADRGYGAHWRRLRRWHLKQHPLCEACEREARLVEATDVDHIVPLRAGGAHTLDNLQALCGTCHRRKTIEHDGGFGRKSQGEGGSFSTKVVN